jgi:hypothetical protein
VKGLSTLKNLIITQRRFRDEGPPLRKRYSISFGGKFSRTEMGGHRQKLIYEALKNNREKIWKSHS